MSTAFRAKTIQNLGRAEVALRRHAFPIFIVSALLAYFFPKLGIAIAETEILSIDNSLIPLNISSLTLLCMMVMLPGAYRFSFSSLHRVILTPRPMLLCLIYIFIFAPAVAFAFSLPIQTLFNSDQAIQIAAGLALISAAPISPGAVMWLNPLRGDVSFAAAIVAMSNFLAPISVPIVLFVAAGSANVQVHLTLEQLIGPLILQVWVPIFIMVLSKRLMPNTLAEIRPIYELAGFVALNLSNYAFISKSVPILTNHLSKADALIVFALVMSYISALFLGSYWISLGLRVPRMERITSMYLCSMRALGPVLATDFSRIAAQSPLSVVPSVFIPFHHLIGKGVYWLILRKAKSIAGNMSRQVIRELYVDYQIVPSNDLGPRFWPDGMRPSPIWHRANVQSIDIDGLTTIGTGSIPPNSVLVARLYHELLSFPLEVKTVRAWEVAVADSEDVFIGNMRFLNVTPEWNAILVDFLKNPVIQVQQKEHAHHAIAA